MERPPKNGGTSLSFNAEAPSWRDAPASLCQQHCKRYRPGDLDDILTASRRNNALMGISGLLLFIDGGFLQMLEGEERAVRELYTRVAPIAATGIPA